MNDFPQLVVKAKTGDTLALSKLLQQNYSFLVKYLMKVTLHPQIAEDLTQETMMKCIEKIQLYNGESKFSSWLITIATNLFIDQQRRKKREKNWLENACIFNGTGRENYRFVTGFGVAFTQSQCACGNGQLAKTKGEHRDDPSGFSTMTVQDEIILRHH